MVENLIGLEWLRVGGSSIIVALLLMAWWSRLCRRLATDDRAWQKHRLRIRGFALALAHLSGRRDYRDEKDISPLQIFRGMDSGLYPRDPGALVSLLPFCLAAGLMNWMVMPVWQTIRPLVSTGPHGLWRSTSCIVVFLSTFGAVVACVTGHVGATAWLAFSTGLGLTLAAVGHFRARSRNYVAAWARATGAAGAFSWTIAQQDPTQVSAAAWVFFFAGTIGFLEYLVSEPGRRRTIGSVGSSFIGVGGVILIVGVPVLAGLALVSSGGALNTLASLGRHLSVLKNATWWKNGWSQGS
jgi:hypothetical protein